MSIVSYKIANIPLIDSTENLCPHVSACMTFVCITHIRAFWFVPLWTEKINIFFDLGASFWSVLLFPSVYGTCYVVVHQGFLVMFFLDNERFSAIFKTREMLGRFCPIIFAFMYYMVTSLELIYRGADSLHFLPLGRKTTKKMKSSFQLKIANK